MRFFSGGRPTAVRRGAAGDAHERLHERQALEGVLGVAHLAVELPARSCST